MSKINWPKALADYLKDETASYAFIAEKYGVSKQAVVKRAVREGWQELRRKTIQKVDQKLSELISESIADVNARHAQMGRLLQAIALKAMKEDNLKPATFMQALRSVVEGIKFEREALGMDRLELVSPKQPFSFSSPEFRKQYEY